MVVTLELRATQSGVIWPRRPLVSTKGLLSCLQNVPHSSYDRRATTFRAVSFNVAGDGFAAADEKGRVFVFFVTSNKYALVQHLGVPTVACSFSPTRKRELLVTCENEMIRCIDVHSQSLISSLRGHRFPARSASFQKSGNLALTASQDAVILWDTKDWSRYRVLNAGPGVEEATFVAKGDLVAVCFQDDSIMMWELESLALRYRFSLPAQEQPAGINKIAVSDDYKVLVATGRSRFIYVWDFEAQTIIRIIELPEPIDDVLTFSFVPGQDCTICLLGNEGSLFFLNVAAKKPKIKMEISNPGRKIMAFDIENHGRYLVACTDDGCLLLYDLDIATESARRARQCRRQQGLHELGESVELRTRSVIGRRDAAIVPGSMTAVRFEEEDEGERPASSKLIDGIFGLKAKRDKENIVTEQQIGFQEKRPTRLSSNRLPSPRPAVVIPAPAKSVALPSVQSSIRQPSKQRSVLQMTSLSQAEIELNRKRLQNSLDCNGKYPAKYRLLVWRFLLQLPKNDDAFKTLAAKGPHPAYIKLHEQYPLKNQRQLRRLHRVISAIAYWCPAFSEVSYLPAIVYPFVKIYRENDIAAFEASLSVLLHWCRDFLISLPYPPVVVLSSIETQLENVDSQLYDHFVKHGISSEIYAWSLLKTIFTEVLSDDEWMCLWDHLITASDKPWMMQVVVIAYLSYFRTALLSAKDRFSIEQFFHQQNALQLHAFIQLVKNFGEKLRITQFKNVAGEGDSAPSYWPLSKAQYPAFANYPKFVVDYQIAERNRIALEEAEMVQKKKLLKRVETECENLKSEHQKWLQQRQALLAAEERRRDEMLAAEKSRILNLKTLDHETRKRRLERLAELEQSAHDTLEQTSNLVQAEYLRLESELGLLRERSNFELSSRRQEEELQRVEFETEKRVADIHKHREIEERLQQLRTEFVTRIKQDELQDILLFESWKRDDEAQRLQAKHDIRKREKDALLQQARTIRQQLEHQLLDHALEKEQQLRELQTQRDGRVHEEQATHRLDENFAAQERTMAEKWKLDCTRERSQVAARSHEEEVVDDKEDAQQLPQVVRRSHQQTEDYRHSSNPTEQTQNPNRAYSASFREVSATREAEGGHAPKRHTSSVRESARSGGQPEVEVPQHQYRMSRRSYEQVGDERDSVIPTERTQNLSTARPTSAQEESANRDAEGGHSSRSHPSSVSGPARSGGQQVVDDHQDGEFDGVAHVANESIRLLDTARRRLSSVLHHSNEDDTGSSNTSSFTSTPIMRTKEEQSLLEKALADISSSSGSCSSEHSVSSRRSQTTASRRDLFEDISPIRTLHHERSISLTNATALLQDDENQGNAHGPEHMDARQPHATTTAPTRGGNLAPSAASQGQLSMSMPSLSSGDESDEASSMLQRPIEELEKELGIRFDDMSEEEKENESDDDELEDDRAHLLQRAKQLLADQSLLLDDEDDK